MKATVGGVPLLVQLRWSLGQRHKVSVPRLHFMLVLGQTHQQSQSGSGVWFALFFGAVLSIFDATEGTLGMRARVRCSPVTPRRGPPAARSGYVHPAGLRTGRSRAAATVKKEEKEGKKTHVMRVPHRREASCAPAKSSAVQKTGRRGGGLSNLVLTF